MRSVLISGGTGFFGRHFSWYLLNNKLADRVCIYSRDEAKQAKMAADFNDDRMRYFIGDVRDPDRLERAMRRCDVVVHAAALKRIEVGAYSPDEMVKTNVVGAMNVIDCAYNAGVEKVVGLSTDKAFQPVSPYGQSKALAESLFRTSNASHQGTKYSVVRYGNVWKSTGSVVPTWQAVLEKGEVLKVTDPDCTRFFMSVEEACELVMDTIDTMQGGELNIPRDLPAYRLRDLVEAFDADYKIVGLPAWEKRHECMDYDCCSDFAPKLSSETLRKLL